MDRRRPNPRVLIPTLTASGLLAMLGAWLAVRDGGGDEGPGPSASTDVARPAPEPRARPAPRPSTTPPPPPPVVVEDDPHEAAHAAHRERVQAVRASCGLPARERCRGEVCATLVAAPDLDRIEGWLEIVWQSPAFVATVAFRDLGGPLRAMPCAEAVDALLEGPVRAVELDDGAELWCTGSGAGSPAGLCNGLAIEAVGPRGARFDQAELRELHLEPRPAERTSAADRTVPPPP